MSKTINAIGDKIFVKVIERPANELQNGIYIPSQLVNDPQNYGQVISIGESVQNISIDDIVVFHPHGGMTVMFDSQEQFKIIKYDEIYGKLSEI